jgi:hypothetical protein
MDDEEYLILAACQVHQSNVVCLSKVQTKLVRNHSEIIPFQMQMVDDELRNAISAKR